MNESQALQALGALAQETRLRIVRYLVGAGMRGAAAGEIGQEVGASSSRLSFHLSALDNGGLVSSERISRKIVYRANFENLGGLIAFLLNDCCNNHPAICECCNVGERAV